MAFRQFVTRHENDSQDTPPYSRYYPSVVLSTTSTYKCLLLDICSEQMNCSTQLKTAHVSVVKPGINQEQPISSELHGIQGTTCSTLSMVIIRSTLSVVAWTEIVLSRFCCSVPVVVSVTSTM